MPTNKNLGPAIMNRDTYIKQVLTEHLLTPSYLQLNPAIAASQISHTKQILIETLQTYRHSPTQPEVDFFTRSFTINTVFQSSTVCPKFIKLHYSSDLR